MKFVDFTREPILETVITPKEGCKLVVRSSKNTGQEEYFVDAVEMVAFGSSFFFRSLERPKAFLVPACDYEVLEVREARVVLKNAGVDRSIKIGGGRESPRPVIREPVKEREQIPLKSFEDPKNGTEEKTEKEASEPVAEAARPENYRSEKKRERRRHYRRRRGKEEEWEGEKEERKTEDSAEVSLESPTPATPSPAPTFSSFLAPPKRLISESIASYKDRFRNAFYGKDSKEDDSKEDGSEIEEQESDDNEVSVKFQEISPDLLEMEEGASQESDETPFYESDQMMEEREEDSTFTGDEAPNEVENTLEDKE